MSLNSFFKSSHLFSKLAFRFSSEFSNVRVSLTNPEKGSRTDENIQKYENKFFNAYLYKRKITRSQIWPKIHIIDNIPEKQQAHLKYQKLYDLKKGIDDEVMKKMVEEDPSQVDSSYIISVFSEDYFKEMMDQYVEKVLVCGKAPTNNEMYEVQKKVIDLYRIFYFGEKITGIQRQIQLQYLSKKQMKFLKHRTTPKNAMLRCEWRQSDQRILEDIVNWRAAQVNLTDINYRPFFEPMNILNRFQNVKKYYELLNGNGFISRMKFNMNIKPDYMVSKRYMAWVAQKLFSRTLHYLNSFEFTQNMQIPSDFMIESSIFYIHIWLIMDRLGEINHPYTKFVSSVLKATFHQYIYNKVQTMNIKRLNVMKKYIHEMMNKNYNSLKMHFRGYQTSRNNYYFAIDALVWTLVFREKVQRYSPQVYLFSEYLIKNFQHLRNYSETDFMNCIIQFDVFLVEGRYEEKIKSLNPPLGEEQFEEEFNSNKKDKKYYYYTLQKDAEYVDGENIQISEKNKYKLFSMENILSMMEKLGRKFSSLHNYDKINALEEQQEELEKKEKKSAWKTEVDRLNKIQEEFQRVHKVRKNRKNSSNIQD